MPEATPRYPGFEGLRVRELGPQTALLGAAGAEQSHLLWAGLLGWSLLSDSVVLVSTDRLELRALSREGELLFEAGGAGEAPGELREPVQVSATSDGFMAFSASGRISAFDLQGRFRSSRVARILYSMDTSAGRERLTYVGVTGSGGFVYSLRSATEQRVMLDNPQTPPTVLTRSVGDGGGDAPFLGVVSRGNRIVVWEASSGVVQLFDEQGGRGPSVEVPFEIALAMIDRSDRIWISPARDGEASELHPFVEVRAGDDLSPVFLWAGSVPHDAHKDQSITVKLGEFNEVVVRFNEMAFVPGEIGRS